MKNKPILKGKPNTLMPKITDFTSVTVKTPMIMEESENDSQEENEIKPSEKIKSEEEIHDHDTKMLKNMTNPADEKEGN